MKYYYEYKVKNGCKVGGHNLKKIEFYDNYIKLVGIDIIQTISGYNTSYWHTLIDMNEIEYLKIMPMSEE